MKYAGRLRSGSRSPAASAVAESSFLSRRLTQRGRSLAGGKKRRILQLERICRGSEMMRNVFSPTMTRLYISEMRKVLPPLLLLCSHGELRPSLCDVTKTTVGFIPLRPTFFFIIPFQSKANKGLIHAMCGVFCRATQFFRAFIHPATPPAMKWLECGTF